MPNDDDDYFPLTPAITGIICSLFHGSVVFTNKKKKWLNCSITHCVYVFYVLTFLGV